MPKKSKRRKMIEELMKKRAKSGKSHMSKTQKKMKY